MRNLPTTEVSIDSLLETTTALKDDNQRTIRRLARLEHSLRYRPKQSTSRPLVEWFMWLVGLIRGGRPSG